MNTDRKTAIIVGVLYIIGTVAKIVSTTPTSEGRIPTDESRFVGPLTSNSRYSSKNLGGLVLPTSTVLPLTSASAEMIPSSSRKR
ncbi:MAG: hypothetical protein O8C63_02720 [Candidatus Methanoperedens sp.]|nr:hypothetical protein [Candidatus Methanoperedens sp.]